MTRKSETSRVMEERLFFCNNESCPSSVGFSVFRYPKDWKRKVTCGLCGSSADPEENENHCQYCQVLMDCPYHGPCQQAESLLPMDEQIDYMLFLARRAGLKKAVSFLTQLRREHET